MVLSLRPAHPQPFKASLGELTMLPAPNVADAAVLAAMAELEQWVQQRHLLKMLSSRECDKTQVRLWQAVPRPSSMPGNLLLCWVTKSNSD